jgi:hypothetical protein
VLERGVRELLLAQGAVLAEGARAPGVVGVVVTPLRVKQGRQGEGAK